MNFIAYNATNFRQIEYIKKLPEEIIEEIPAELEEVPVLE